MLVSQEHMHIDPITSISLRLTLYETPVNVVGYNYTKEDSNVNANSAKESLVTAVNCICMCLR